MVAVVEYTSPMTLKRLLTIFGKIKAEENNIAVINFRRIYDGPKNLSWKLTLSPIPHFDSQLVG